MPRLIIDELPVIAVAAAFAEGETVIRDAQELKVKESNRIAAMVAELTKAGVDVEETDDGMIVRRGGAKPHGAAFETCSTGPPHRDEPCGSGTCRRGREPHRRA